MAVNLSPLGGVAAQFFNNDGVPLSGGLIYTYTAGTNTPANTYTTGAGTISHSNPIVLDSAGRVPTGEIWLTDNLAYKFVIKDAQNNLIGTYDNIVGINSNFVNYTASQEIQTATAGQTVFTLTTMAYQPGTNSLSVFVDGVNQYGPGAQYAFVETSSTSVTFASGLHVGASVKFTTAVINNIGGVDASQVTYDPPFANSVVTNVEAKLAQVVSVTDFGAVGDGVTDDTAAFVAALNESNNINIPNGTYYLTSTITLSSHQSLTGESVNGTILLFDGCDGIKGTNPVDTVQVSLTNLTLQLGASPTANTNTGIDAREWSYCTVKNVNTVYFETGVYLARPNAGACWFNVFDTMYIHIAKFGVLIDDPNYSVNSNWFLNINVDDVGQFSGGYGFHVQGYGNYFHNIYSAITNGSAGVYFDAISGDNVIYGLYVESEPTYSIWQANGTTRTNIVLGFHLDGSLSTVRDDSGGLTFLNGSTNIFPSTTQFGTDSTYHAGLVTVVVADNTDGLKVTSSGSKRTNFKIANTGTGGAAWTFQTSDTGNYGGGAGQMIVFRDTTGVFIYGNDNTLKPYTDNTQALGGASNRWSVVYAGTGTINTSDAREKQQIRDVSEAEKRAAQRIKSMLRAFKFNDAVATKGDKARIHFGVVAQDVKTAFELEGLNADDYGLFCLDKWDSEPETKDEQGNIVMPAREAGERYGVRYEELLAFVIAAM